MRGERSAVSGGLLAADWFYVLSASPNPAKRIADLTDGGLDAAIQELSAIASPNAYQADLAATCLVEAVRRWQANVPKPETGNGEI